MLTTTIPAARRLLHPLAAMLLALVVVTPATAAEDLSGLYELGSAVVEFRTLRGDADADAAFAIFGAEKEQKAAAEDPPVIPASSIDGILVSKEAGDDDPSRYTVRVLIKESALAELPKQTEKVVGKSLGFIKGTTVLLAPRVLEPLASPSIDLTGLGEDKVAFLVEGLGKQPAAAAETAQKKLAEKLAAHEKKWIEQAKKSGDDSEKLFVAFRLMQRKAFDEALSILEPLAAKDNPETWMVAVSYLGGIYTELKRYGDAVTLYETAIKKDRGNWFLRKDLAKVNALQKNYEGAYNQLTQVLSEYDKLLEACALEQQVCRLEKDPAPSEESKQLMDELKEQVRQLRGEPPAAQPTPAAQAASGAKATPQPSPEANK